MEEASFLTKFASQVYIVHRRDELRASKIMQERALGNPKITVLYSHIVQRIHGDGKLMTGVTLRNLKKEEHEGGVVELPASGLFFAIGHQPNTQFLEGCLETDESGYVRTQSGSTKTSVPGVFACGDVQDKKYRQAITAAGSGCMAALDAEHYLNDAKLL